MGVFDIFTSEPYQFLELDQRAEGNKVVDTANATGIFKIREGMTRADNLETETADATIKIRPSEPFVAALEGQLVGHGIRVSRGENSTQDYRIIGQIEGQDYDLNVLDFYLLTLKKEQVTQWDESTSPLE